MHFVSLLALSALYYDAIAKDNTETENLVAAIIQCLRIDVRKRDLNVSSEIGDMTTAILDSTLFDTLDSFDEKLNETAKFFCSHMKQTENLLEFICASREPNFLLHLSLHTNFLLHVSLHTNVKYVFAHDLYKYARSAPST